MEMKLTNGFNEITVEEMDSINGGGVIEGAVAVVTVAGAALVGGFRAGRQFVRDVKNKFFN